MLHLNTCVVLWVGTDDETIGYIVAQLPETNCYDIELASGETILDVRRDAFVLFAE